MTQTPQRHAPPQSFTLSLERIDDGEVPVIAVHGELDLFTAPELRERLREHTDTPDEMGDVVVDLSGCAFVDASGCQVLLRAARRLSAQRRGLAIVNVSTANERIFSVMGLDELFPVVASRAAAVEELARRRT